MKRALFFIAMTLALGACQRPEPSASAIEPQRVADAADEKHKTKPPPDTQLSAIVRSAIISDSSLDANRIDIENKAGNVALYGSVDSTAQRDRAERIVNSIGGVKSVANHLTVSQRESGGAGTGSTAQPDPDIELPAKR